MNIKEQDKGYREMLERYIDAGKTSIEYQSDSFNSMDSKSQIYIGLLSVLAVFLIDRKPVFEDTHLSLLKLVFVIFITLVILNIILFFVVIFSKKFSYGRSIADIRKLDQMGKSIEEIDKDISDSLEISSQRNELILKKKGKYFKIAEIILICLLVITLILFLITSL